MPDVPTAAAKRGRREWKALWDPPSLPCREPTAIRTLKDRIGPDGQRAGTSTATAYATPVPAVHLAIEIHSQRLLLSPNLDTAEGLVPLMRCERRWAVRCW